VPKGLTLTGTGYPVYETLPGILGARQQNRGLEALGISRAEHALYLAVQSPLANPDKKTGKASSVARILRVDLRTGRPTGEWAHVMENVATFDPAAEQGDMKISALTVLSPGRLLLQERTDAVARLYSVDLRKATNLLGGPHDDPATTPSLEASLPADVTPATKSLAVDLAAIDGLPAKIEGVADRPADDPPSPPAAVNLGARGPRDLTPACSRTDPSRRAAVPGLRRWSRRAGTPPVHRTR
jgi:hypothetical protein